MWFWYALTAAGVSAVSVILNKKALKNISVPLVSWALMAFSLPILIIPAFSNGWPIMNLPLFAFGVIASGLFFGIGKTLSLKSIKDGVVSEEVWIGSAVMLLGIVLIKLG